MTLEQHPTSDLILAAICDLLRRPAHDDAKFLHPEEFTSNHAASAARVVSNGSGVQSETLTWIGAPEWAALRETVDRHVGRLMPTPTNGPNGRRGNLSDSRLLVEEYLLRYSPRTGIRRIHPQLRGSVLEAACLEWAAITESPPQPVPRAVDTWGFDISLRVLSNIGEADDMPRHTKIDPLLSFVGQEVMASFDNPDILRFAPALGSRLEILLLRIVDAYATKVRRDPRETVMQRFLAEPELFEDPDAVRREDEEYRQAFDREVDRIRGLAHEVQGRSTQPVLSTADRQYTELDRELVFDLIERSKLLGQPCLAKRLRKTSRRISARLRAYRSLVSAERKKITHCNREVKEIADQIRSSLPREPWAADEAMTSTRLIAKAEAVLNLETNPAIAELHDASARTRRRASSIINALRGRRARNEDRAKAGLTAVLQEGHQIRGANHLEYCRLAELYGEASHRLRILAALDSSVPDLQTGGVAKIRAKITEYENRVGCLEEAVADLEAALPRTRPETRDVLGAGLDLHHTLATCTIAADSACQECSGDDYLADLVTECRQLTDQARLEIVRIEEEALTAYSERTAGLVRTIDTRPITTHQRLQRLALLEEELSLLERAADYFGFASAPVETLRKTSENLRTQYSNLVAQRRAKIAAVRSSASGLRVEVRTLFHGDWFAPTVADTTARMRVLVKERDLIGRYRDDEALADLVDRAIQQVEGATKSFSTNLKRHVETLRSVVTSAKEGCSSIDRCTWREFDELHELESELGAVKNQLESLQTLTLLDAPEAISEADAVRARITGLLEGYRSWQVEATAFLDQVSDEAENLHSVAESIRSPQDTISSDGLVPSLMTVGEYASRAAVLRSRADPFRADPTLAGHPAFAAMDRAQRCLSDTSLFLLESAVEDCESRINTCLASPIETMQEHSKCGAVRGHLAEVVETFADLECGLSTQPASQAKGIFHELARLDARAAEAMARYKKALARRRQKLEQIRSALAHDPFRKVERTPSFGVLAAAFKQRLRQIEATQQQLASLRSWRIDQGLKGHFDTVDQQLRRATTQTDSVGPRLLAHLAGHRQTVEAEAEKLCRDASWFTYPIAALRAARLRRNGNVLAKAEARLRSEITSPSNVVQIDQHRATRRNTA